MPKFFRHLTLAAAATAMIATAAVSSAEAGCRYYGPGSTGCAHKAPRFQPPVYQPQPQPQQNYSYGRVWVRPGAIRSGGGILMPGSRRMGAAWVAPSCRRMGAALFC